MEDETEKRGRGRPTKYKPEYVNQARKLCELGATDYEIARFFDVSTDSIQRWRIEHEEFGAAIRIGKEHADARVARALYSRAVGYTFESEKVFQFKGKIIRADTTEHVPPDPGAAMSWLCNRQPDVWRNKQSLEHSGPDGGPVQFQRVERVIVDPANSDS